MLSTQPNRVDPTHLINCHLKKSIGTQPTPNPKIAIKEEQTVKSTPKLEVAIQEEEKNTQCYLPRPTRNPLINCHLKKEKEKYRHSAYTLS